VRAKAHWPHCIDSDSVILKEPYCTLDFKSWALYMLALRLFFLGVEIRLLPFHEVDQTTCSTARNRPPLSPLLSLGCLPVQQKKRGWPCKRASACSLSPKQLKINVTCERGWKDKRLSVNRVRLSMLMKTSVGWFEAGMDQ
jgi:hypothetical protein